jgi:hypothetical protein
LTDVNGLRAKLKHLNPRRNSRARAKTLSSGGSRGDERLQIRTVEDRGVEINVPFEREKHLQGKILSTLDPP